jgi:hypothetical protein
MIFTKSGLNLFCKQKQIKLRYSNQKSKKSRKMQGKHPNSLENLKNGVPLKNGYDERRVNNGRKKKFIALAKDIGYSAEDALRTIQNCIAMDLEELKALFENPESTVLEKTIAKALQTDLKKGGFKAIEFLMNRVWGQPKQSIESKMAIIDLSQLSTEELKERLKVQIELKQLLESNQKLIESKEE